MWKGLGRSVPILRLLCGSVFLPMHDDDDPLWKQILTHEILWVVVGAVLVLVIAFHFATR